MRSCENPEHKVMFFDDYVERIIQQHTSNLLNNGLRSHHAMHTAKYIKMAKPTVLKDLKGLVRAIFPNYLEGYYEVRRPEVDPAFHEDFNYGRQLT